MADLSELGKHLFVSSKKGNYPHEEAAETLYWDGEPEHEHYSSEKEETHPIGQCQV